VRSSAANRLFWPCVVALFAGGGWTAYINLFKPANAPPPTTITTTSNQNGVVIGTVNGTVQLPAEPATTSKLSAGIDPRQIDDLVNAARQYGQTEQKLTQSQIDVETARKISNEWRYLYFARAAPHSIDMLRELAAYPLYHPTVTEFSQRWSAVFSESTLSSEYAVKQILADGEWISDTDGRISVTAEGLRLLAVFHQMPAVVTTQSAVSPSFKCEDARIWVERAICATPKLATLDVQTKDLYLKWRTASGDANFSRDEQAEWRRTSRDVCTVTSCIELAYTNRFAELSRRLGGTTEK